MANRKKPRKEKIPQVPIHGKAAHNTAFLTSIGGLIVNWANNESVFLALLQLFLIGGTHSAAIVWHSHRTTNARLELIGSLARERVKDEQLLQDITNAIKRFKGFTGTRNFYCHATYRYDSDLCLASATATTNAQVDEPLKFEVKRMDLAALNEMKFASVEMGKFNRELWKLVLRLQTELGVQHVNLPPLLQEQKSDLDAPTHQGKG
ncbi:MAG TPA: hypothetical protein VFV71_12995 [Burkholderiales bacterium]|nr:hypothetical protein [Burkholderiales bacterium]